MNLPGAQVANAAVVELPVVIAAVGGFRGPIGMRVVTEMRGDLRLLERAIGRSRRERELEGQQQEEANGEEAAHGRIMAEVREF